MSGCRVQFDSSLPNSRWPRRLGAARRMLRCDYPYQQAILIDQGVEKQHWDHPLDALHWLSADARRHDWVGWISYDLGRWFEKIPSRTRDDLRLPLFVFTTHDPLDSSFPGIPGEGSEISNFKSQITNRKNPHPDPLPAYRERGLISTFTRQAYEASVQRVIDYISAGDVFQANLAQRFTAPLSTAPHEIYRRLCSEYPAAYGAYLEYDDFALVCNSPELFLRVTPDRRVITRPIKGTRPRMPGMDNELRDSLKDQAELNMIVDLERNDLGRVCEVGSVKVIEPRAIEAHPTVYHGVATIEGKLRDDVSFVDLLRATFPGGSITGAPKIRAMEIIEELEPHRRGPYCGAIGHLDSDGTIEFNIAIRTMIAKDGFIHIPVGGGIVADSDPKDEYEETLVKTKAMFAAVGVET